MVEKIYDARKAELLELNKFPKDLRNCYFLVSEDTALLINPGENITKYVASDGASPCLYLIKFDRNGRIYEAEMLEADKNSVTKDLNRTPIRPEEIKAILEEYDLPYASYVSTVDPSNVTKDILNLKGNCEIQLHKSLKEVLKSV